MHNFDAVYVASTLLNPVYQKILNDKQEEKAKGFTLQLMLRKRKDSEIEQQLLAGSQENETNSNEDSNNQDALSPPTKRFKHLERVSKLLDEDDK